MKRYFYILFVGALLSLTSCVQDEIFVDIDNTPNQKGGIQIIGAVEEFDEHYVGTRADEVSDSYISEMTMLIFDNDNNLLPAYEATDMTMERPISSHIHIDKPNPTFLIETSKYNGTGILASMEAGITMKYYNNKATNISKCKIYIVANAWHLIGPRLENYEIKTLADLEKALVDTDITLQMPVDAEGKTIGLPMIGTHVAGTTFNLAYNAADQNNAVATIPLKKLYSKIYFRMQVNSNQIVTGQTPKFQLEGIEVYNVPKSIRMEYKEGQYIDNVANGSISADNIKDYYLYNSVNGTPCKLTLPTKTTVYHSSSATTNEYLEWSFYVPEHMVTSNDISYPTNMPAGLRQYYKPKRVGAVQNSDGTTSPAKIATFVRIKGSYTDHNAQINNVSYDIYLGQDNWKSFEIKRNQQLNNILTITGITNHKDAYHDTPDNVSIDHRVSMTSKGYNLSMEREAILDAHFEVRPLDVELSPGGSMTVVIPADYKDIIAMESDAASKTATGEAKNLYVDNTTPRKGVRKYFTTSLVSDLWTANGGQIKLKHSGKDNTKTEIHRIWFYVDENPNVYDKKNLGLQKDESDDHTVTTDLYRLSKVNFYYGNSMSDDENIPDAPNTDATPNATINFQQWNLWRVWSADGKRYYDIEHEEEYLNNYVSDAVYGAFPDGMAWGLDGVQLSDSIPAYWSERHRVDVGSGILAWILEGLIDLVDSWFNISTKSAEVFAKSGEKPYYDFYLSRDNFPVNKLGTGAVASDYARDYKGIEFNREIAATLRANYTTQQVTHTNPQGNLAQIEKLNLTQAPSSAFAYCYHKNRRNSDGDVVELKWFLPAIDEIEDIALGAYDEFDKVFQNKEYWSCQPAYDYNTIKIGPNSDGYDLSPYIWFEGEYYSDNTSRARSTSVYATSVTTYTTIESGLPNGVVSGHLAATAYSGGSKNGQVETVYSPITINYNATIYTTGDYRGNSSRGESCRIRAVYRSGTK